MERSTAGRRLVEDRAEREDVGALIDDLALRLLGRHVGSRTQHHALAGQRCHLGGHLGRQVPGRRLRVRRQFGETEVEHLEPAVARQHDVRRLEIAMYHALFVRHGERFGDRQGDIERLRQREAAGRHGAVEAFTFDQLHGDERRVALALDRVDGDDVGMVECRDRLGLALKALQALRVGSHLRGQHLEGHVTLQVEILGPIDLPHAAFTQLGGDLEVGKCLADQDGSILLPGRIV